jgi:ParB family chromosome partitioning protein
MKRDLLFVVERLAALLDERRLEIVARQRGIKKAKDSDSIGKLFTAYLRSLGGHPKAAIRYQLKTGHRE